MHFLAFHRHKFFLFNGSEMLPYFIRGLMNLQTNKYDYSRLVIIVGGCLFDDICLG